MIITSAILTKSFSEYICGFPVHQDGSCNGLQHYAALGGDSAGAAAVNLAPLDRPQDVYSEVAALVNLLMILTGIVFNILFILLYFNILWSALWGYIRFTILYICFEIILLVS